MAGCGYVCPKCEGQRFLLDSLEPCDWCQKIDKKMVTLTDEEWIKSVHESNCCSDIGVAEETHSITNLAT